MIKKNIPQMEPLFGIEEQEALNAYMKSGGWLTEFKRTKKFEEVIADFTGAKYCFAVNNGTVSLTIAAIAAGIKTGDEVIIPNYSMIATPNSIKIIGASPVFVDVEPSTLCMDANLAEQAITDKTSAIMLVAANGRYPKSGIDTFITLAEKYNLHLLEDSAQALGSYYPGGKHIGSVGKIGSFSFSTPKVISTGQGGALITNDEKLALQISKLKDFGRTQGGNDIHDTIGYNFKFTDLQAVIGIEQMKKLSWRVKRKKEIYKLYMKELSGEKSIHFFDQDLVNTTPWFIDMIVEKRFQLATFLKNHGIGTRVMYPPINKQKAYDLPGEYPVSSNVGANGLWLPSSSNLTDDDVKYITKKIRDFYKNN